MVLNAYEDFRSALGNFVRVNHPFKFGSSSLYHSHRGVFSNFWGKISLHLQNFLTERRSDSKLCHDNSNNLTEKGVGGEEIKPNQYRKIFRTYETTSRYSFLPSHDIRKITPAPGEMVIDLIGHSL